MVPITFITFFQYVYNFGPKHRKRSLFDILSNPVPGVKFDGCIGKSKDCASLKRRQFNKNFVAQKIAQDKHLSAKRVTWSFTVIINDRPMAHINNAAPVLLGYQIYVHTTGKVSKYQDFLPTTCPKGKIDAPKEWVSNITNKALTQI
jgi:hypothetical protein